MKHYNALIAGIMGVVALFGAGSNVWGGEVASPVFSDREHAELHAELAGLSEQIAGIKYQLEQAISQQEREERIQRLSWVSEQLDRLQEQMIRQHAQELLKAFQRIESELQEILLQPEQSLSKETSAERPLTDTRARASISGTLYQEDGSTPLSGTVLVYTRVPPSGWLLSTSATASQNGIYTVAVSPGTYYLKAMPASGENYLKEWWANAQSTPDDRYAQPVVVLDNGSIAGKDFQLDMGAIISGTVTQAGTGIPITGESVWPYAFTKTSRPCTGDEYFSLVDATERFDSATGAYELVVPAGTYYVSAQAQTHSTEWWASSGSVAERDQAELLNITAGSVASDIDFQLDPQGEIRGTLYQHDGVTPVTGSVTVALFQGDPCGVYSKKGGGVFLTPSTGAYRMPKIRPGTYFLRAASRPGANYIEEWWAEGGSTANRCDATTVSVMAGEIVAGKDFQLDEGGSISGSIFHRDGITPLLGYSSYVIAYPDDPCNLASHMSDIFWEYRFAYPDSATGEYTIMGLATGSYYIHTLGSGPIVDWWASPSQPYSTTDCQNARAVSVSAGSAVTGKHFQVEPPGTISGHVYGGDGQTPLECVEVQAWDAGSGAALASEYTTPDGRYELRALPIGPYKIQACASCSNVSSAYHDEYYENKPSYHEADPVTVQGLNTLTVDFELTAEADSSCYVHQNGNPLPHQNSVHTFSNVPLGGEQTATFTIENSGGAALELTGTPIVQLESGFPDFQVARQPDARTLLPGEATTFDITYAPTTAEAQAPVLSIASTASSTNPYTIRLFGRASRNGAPFAAEYQGGYVVGGSLLPTADGGYLLTDATSRFGAGSTDAWILKLDADGGILWQRTYGGVLHDRAFHAAQTVDGGYIVSGETASRNGYTEAWIMKLDALGRVEWEHTYGYKAWMNEAYEITPTRDGGYLFATSGGMSAESGSEVDALVVKLDQAGNIQWQYGYGGLDSDGGVAVYETADGAYIVLGYTQSFGAGSRDAWILKLAADGQVLWQHTYGGPFFDSAVELYANPDGSLVVVGGIGNPEGYQSALIFKVDADGTLLWQQGYDIPEDWDELAALDGTADGGYVAAGRNGLWKFDNVGALVWQRSIGDNFVRRTSTGSYIVIGRRYHAGNGPYRQVYVIDEQGNLGNCPAPDSDPVTPVAPNITVGTTSVTRQVRNIPPGSPTSLVQTTAVLPEYACKTIFPPDITVHQDGNPLPHQNSVHTFSTVPLGGEQTATFTIENSGGAALELTGTPIVQLESGFPDFQVSRQPDAQTLFPGEATTFDITYAPTTAEAQAPVLSIASTASSMNPYTIRLFGRASRNGAPFAAVYSNEPHWFEGYGSSILPTADGGYLLTDTTSNFGAGDTDAWILKLDADGGIIWQRTYGGVADDRAFHAAQTADGGYIVAGETASHNSSGYFESWIFKLDALGRVEWENMYGVKPYSNSYAITPTRDGGYIFSPVGGRVGESNVDVPVVKLDQSGNIQWQYVYGGLNEDVGLMLRETADNAYIVLGYTESFGAGDGDAWIFKLDADGQVLWQHTYGGPLNDAAADLHVNPDGSVIVVGGTGDAAGYAAWIFKLDADGTLLWQQGYETSDEDSHSLTVLDATADGAYVAVSLNGLWKFDDAGAVLWQRGIGGDFVRQTRTGSYVVIGKPGDLPNGAHRLVYVIDEQGNVGNCPISDSATITPVVRDITVGTTSVTPQVTDIQPGFPTSLVQTTAVVPEYVCETVLPPEMSVHQNGNPLPHQNSVHTFSTVPLGTEQTATFTIENSGGAALELTGTPIVQLESGFPDFYVTRQPDVQTLLPGESTTFEITYAPTTTEPQTPVLSIDSTAPDTSPYTIRLFGRASRNGAPFAAVYPGGWSFYGSGILPTTDGGYLLTDTTSSVGAGNDDAWIVKLDADGGILWQRTYGGIATDHAFRAAQTVDGGYIVTGETSSHNSDGHLENWILKLDALGLVEWESTYGVKAYNDWYEITPTRDGGYIFSSMSGTVGDSNVDLLVVKLNQAGEIQWQSLYGGSGLDSGGSVRETADNAYIVLGYTESFGAGKGDAWILKLDANGQVLWQRTYGGPLHDAAADLHVNPDGSLMLVGGISDAAGTNPWIFKLDADGGLLWQQGFETPGDDYDLFLDLDPTIDGAYVAVSLDGLWKFDDAGTVLWQRNIGGDFVSQTATGSYVVIGSPYDFPNGAHRLVYVIDEQGNLGNCPAPGSDPITPVVPDITVGTTNVTPQIRDIPPGSPTSLVQTTAVLPEYVCETLAPPYSLTVAHAGTGAGLVTSQPAGIDCGTECHAAYNAVTTVQLQAVPEVESIFQGWSGGGCSGTGICAVTVDGVIAVTATFDNPCGGAEAALDFSIPSGRAFSCGTTHSIRLLPGFHAEQGSVFRGYIEP